MNTVSNAGTIMKNIPYSTVRQATFSPMFFQDADFVVDILGDESEGGSEEAEEAREFFIGDHVLIHIERFGGQADLERRFH